MITIFTVKIGSELTTLNKWIKIKRNYILDEKDIEKYRSKILYKAKKYFDNPLVEFNYKSLTCK
jgi:hypothetical protein